MGPSSSDFLGNLPPVSTPENPANFDSDRQVSNVVSPPNSGKSSFDQAIGAIPNFAFTKFLQTFYEMDHTEIYFKLKTFLFF